MSEPIAYLLTWTCYGTWVHGDERGSVDTEHNAPDSPFLSPNPRRHATRKQQMRFSPCRLDPEARRTVSVLIVDHCKARGWTLHAVSVRTNHAHAVVSCDVTPQTAMSQLKAWATRRLRERGLHDAGAPVWTEGGSRRYIWTREGLRHAVEYVMEYQGD